MKLPILYCWIYTKIRENNKDFNVLKTCDYKKAISNIRIPKAMASEIMKELTGEIPFTNIPLISRIDHTKYKILKNNQIENRIKRLNLFW